MMGDADERGLRRRLQYELDMTLNRSGTMTRAPSPAVAERVIAELGNADPASRRQIEFILRSTRPPA